ncbi:hypothetical protein CC80DRAFT_516221 [Byssothecium circinans]|uniref:Histone H1 n=1 Tax=Byssothecium circinans TaxID=147558 RepID=A0A6A5TX90_9PLEO|nr:hypothetical protein CC80DRAFT_516221 [Byssothecium circinans]
MPPKKSSTATPKKSAAAAPAHGSYIDMVKDAIVSLKERNGSSRQAIQKYIRANNKTDNVSDAMFKSLVNRAISAGEEKGTFSRPKGPSGTVKIAKKEPKPAAAKAEAKSPKPEKKAAAPKKSTATKKTAAPVHTLCIIDKLHKLTVSSQKAKAAPKKTATKKTAAPKAKATTAKTTKANASKPRKTETPAPAVEKEVSRVLGKTKSGRVTKTQAPAAAAPKKAPAKKTATKKAPAKKGTPKKATPKKAAA